jgi:uncharacterized protein
MKPRIIFLHGNQSTHWSFAWTPWLKAELEKRGYETFFETFPDSIIARASYWLPFLASHVKAGKNDVLVGWSSGAVAAMRYAEEHPIKGSVLIAPCVSDLGDELEKQSGYFVSPWKWDQIKANQEHVVLVYGTDDPFIPQDQFMTIEQELQPETIVIPEGKHFMDRKEFPEVLEYLINTYP